MSAARTKSLTLGAARSLTSGVRDSISQRHLERLPMSAPVRARYASDVEKPAERA